MISQHQLEVYEALIKKLPVVDVQAAYDQLDELLTSSYLNLRCVGANLFDTAIVNMIESSQLSQWDNFYKGLKDGTA